MAPPPPNWVDAEPYHYNGTQQQQQAAEDGSGAGGDEGEGEGKGEVRSLWIGGLLDWMDEDYLYSCFTRSPELLSVVIKRNKQNRQSEGFGFLNFSDHAVADQILHSYNGQKMPNANRDFKLNWVANSAPREPDHDGDSENSIFVGDLAFDVTDYMLYNVFRSRYPSVNCAKVIWDNIAAHSKGYGFVTFGDVNERRQAMTEMNGAYCSTRRMRIRPAPNNKGFGANGTDSDRNPNNTRLFVGGLDQSVTHEDLEKAFGPYGEIVGVYVVAGKSCGFVTYSSRASAEETMRILNGSQLGDKTIRVCWCRPPNKQGSNMRYTGHPGFADYQQQQSHETTVQ